MGHLGFFIAGGATAPPGAILMVESYVLQNAFGSMPPELQGIMNRMLFGFWVTGLILIIVGSVLLITGLIKYKNRYGKYSTL
ncbi:MAG: hypothetical protein HWN65_20395 [Candidatus Helarchaeota archaeon]|nr:hypothetical protein [Candidatus Helarchaeota archaeon]